MGLFSSREVHVSAKNARHGQAFWQCPYCRKGQTGMRSTGKAIEAAREHIEDKHPGVISVNIRYAN